MKVKISIMITIAFMLVSAYALIPKKEKIQDKILVDKLWILDTGLIEIDKNGNYKQIDPSSVKLYRINDTKFAVDEDWLFRSGLLKYGKNAEPYLLNTTVSYFEMGKITRQAIEERNKILEILYKERRERNEK